MNCDLGSRDRSRCSDHRWTTRPTTHRACRRLLGVCCITVVWISGISGITGIADAQETGRQGALDDELLSGLAPMVESHPSGSKPSAEEPATTNEPSRPFQLIQRRMLDVRERLKRFDTTAETRREQAIIVSQIDEFLSRLTPAKAPAMASSLSKSRPGDNLGSKPLGNGQPSRGQGSQPGSDSTAPPGDPTTPVTPRGRSKLLEEAWGSLPAQQRQQLRAASPDAFLPQYSRLIEDYYKRLAEEPRP